MFLSNLSIKQPVFATMMMVALAVLGLASYRQLDVDQFPDIEFPIVLVNTVYPGASPETVEREVTKKIEEAINTVEGIKHVESTSQEGVSTIVILFRLEVPTAIASQDIRGKVASIRGDLPREIEEPIVQRFDVGGQPVISVAVNAAGLSAQAATELADKTVKRRLETVRGVGAVNLVGEAKREIQVVVDRSKLEAYRISLAEVVVRPRARERRRAGGRRRPRSHRGPRARGQPRPLRRRHRPDPGQARGRHHHLRERRRPVIDGVKEAKNLALLDERPALALDVLKQSGANTVAVADGVRAAIEKLGTELPSGVTLQVVRDDSTFIRESIHDVNLTMILGRRPDRPHRLPLPELVALHRHHGPHPAHLRHRRLRGHEGLRLHHQRHDPDGPVARHRDADRRRDRGAREHRAPPAARQGPRRGRPDGTAEIGLAVMATTFTIVAVFIPVAFMGGMVGQFFYEFGITVAAAVLVSLFVSFTLDPMLSSRWVDPDVEQDRHDTRPRQGARSASTTGSTTCT